MFYGETADDVILVESFTKVLHDRICYLLPLARVSIRMDAFT